MSLRDEFGNLVGWAKRRKLARTPFVQSMMAAWDNYLAERKAGATKSEATANLEKTLRLTWPQTREWKYLCLDCDDTGLIRLVCKPGQRCAGISSRSDSPHDPPGKYERLCRKHPESAYEHDYTMPCHCAKGDRFKPKPRTIEDELAAVGKVSKPTRFGR